MGPITHNMKTEKDPRTAMIEPKSGTSIDTATARQTMAIRSQAINIRLSERLNLQADVACGFLTTSELGV